MAMRLVCEAATLGGPVVVLPLPDARKWTGVEGDYYSALGSCTHAILQHFERTGLGSAYLFREIDDGDYVVYADASHILLLCEIYSPDEGSAPKNRLPQYQSHVVPGTRIDIAGFGGQVAIFDSAFPGRLIALQGSGVERIAPVYEPRDGRVVLPNAIVVEVEYGAWQAFEVCRQDQDYSFVGVLFCRLEN